MGSWSFAPRDAGDGDNGLVASLPIVKPAVAGVAENWLSHITSS